jgi:hypothetical protein
MDFSYDTETDYEKVQAVAAEMMGSCGLKPLTDEEIAEREIWRAEHRAWIEQERIASEQHRRVRERQLAEVAQRERAIAARAERERAQRERAHEIDRQVTQRSLSDLRLQSAQQTGWQRDITRAMQNQAAYQARETILSQLSQLEQMINPPTEPEPTVVVVEADQEDDAFCGVKITRPNLRRSWW